MPAFFKQFPTVDIEIEGDNQTVVNIFRNVDLIDVLADDVTGYEYVDIIDGERPDHLSQRLYGTPNYYWTFFIVNDSLKNVLHDWPMGSHEFEANMVLKYDPYAGIMIIPDKVSDDYPTMDGLLPAGSDWVYNDIASLDLTYPYLLIERNGATAKIKEFDVDRLMLIVYDFSDREQFTATGDYDIFIRVDEDNYEQDSVWRAWVKNLCKWRQDMIIELPPTTNNLTYDYYLSLEAATNDEDTLNNNIYENFMDSATGYFRDDNIGVTGYPPLGFKVNALYSDMRKAPRYFTDAQGNRTRYVAGEGGSTGIYEYLTPYIANEIYSGAPPFYVTNFEHDSEINDQNSKIKIVKSQYIAEFANEYKRLIVS